MTPQAALALVLAAAAFSIASTLAPSDPDLWWHLASARWMVEHGAPLSRDSFSHTAAGAPYSVGEWLGQLVFYGAYLAGGWQGIGVLRAAVVAVATFFTARATLLAQPRPAAAILPLLAALLVTKTTWSERPQLFTLALFAVFYAVLLEALLRGRPTGSLWLLPPLELLWANLHAGYPLGLALIGVFALGSALARSPLTRSLTLVLGVSGILALASPDSLGVGAGLLHVARPPRFIAEELPTDLLTPAGLLFAALLLFALAAALLVGRGQIAFAVILPPLVLLGFSAQRYLPIGAIALAPYVSRAVPDVLTVLWPRLRIGPLRRVVVRPGIATTLVVLLLASAVAAARAAPREPDESRYPAGALAALPVGGGNLLNEYDWGGYLIWKEPAYPVFIDGRLFLYVPQVFDDYVEATDLGPAFAEVLERRAVRLVLLRPGRPLAVHLRGSGWRVLAEEPGRFVLLERP